MINKLSPLVGISQRAGTVYVRNVLSPLLWLCAVIVPALLMAAGFAGFGTTLSYVFVFFIMFFIIFILGVYLYFALTDPQRLQSEHYQLRTQELMLQSKSGHPVRDSSDLVEIENPEITVEQIEDKGDEP